MTIDQITFDFSAVDESGAIIAVIGYCIVFAALVLLFTIFNFIPKLLKFNLRRKLRRQGKPQADLSDSDLNISVEENAAIAMAIYLYFYQLHDEESNVVTIKKVSRTYSPWSSKIYGLQNFSRKNKY